MSLFEPLRLGSHVARNRIVFGPHETNLARRRAISDRHLAYYRRRAAGGAGVVVFEEASVHRSDWPYERSPLAIDCGEGWAACASAVQEEGALAIAAIGHAGGQGSSAYSQAPLWAPSRVPEVNSREVPKWMEAGDIRAVVEGFAAAARLATHAGLDGVEVNAGQHSLVRQFLSGLTNHRGDEWGEDKLLFARQVLTAVRRALGEGAAAPILGLRLSCDELAPWAGLTPESAVDVAVALADHVDYVTVVRGAIFTAAATRPDGHTDPGFNLDLARAVRAALPERVAVIAQGSIVDVGQAEWAVSGGEGRVCDAVEMTRAQIADAALANKAGQGRAAEIRPCILCNQACQVRDARNPIVSCVVDPASGHEWEEAPVDLPVAGAGSAQRHVLVVGGGPAGLECARVASLLGFRVRLVEAAERVGGMVRVAAQGSGRSRLSSVVDWLEAECLRLGVVIETGKALRAADLGRADGAVVLCTGSLPGKRNYEVDDGAVVLTAAEALSGSTAIPAAGPLLIWDPIGGPIGVSVAEKLRSEGREVGLATQDLIAGNELSRSGDLAPANVRLLASGVVIEKRSLLRRVGPGEAELEDKYTGERRTLEAAAVIDCGHRLPDDRLWRETNGRHGRAGDSVAPRSILEAILEGRRAAVALAAQRPSASYAGSAL